MKRDRIQTLLFVKNEKYTYQSDIGKKPGRQEKTIRVWLQDYEKNGGNNLRTISDKMINLFETKVSDSKSTITYYVELMAILEEETGETIENGALYYHCKRKLKVAKKSHHKKKIQTQKRS